VLGLSYQSLEKKSILLVYVSWSISSTWQAYMALPVCCREVATESLVNEVTKWNKCNFDCYSLLTRTKLDSRTAVLWTRTYRVAMWQLSIWWHSSAKRMEVVSCCLWTWNLQMVDNISTHVPWILARRKFEPMRLLAEVSLIPLQIILHCFQIV